MATVVNTPASSDSGGGFSFLLGAILLLFVGFLFIVYGIPALRNSIGGASQAPQVQIPVPDKIDVNVNQPGNPQ